MKFNPNSRYLTKYLLLFFILLLVLLSTFIIKQHVLKKTKPNRYAQCDPIHNATAPISPSNTLNDKNDVHLLHAQKNGLRHPFKTNQEFDSLKKEFVEQYKLIEVTENRFFQLKSLTHSQPYLIPEAIDMLNEIGIRFQDKLKEKKYPNYRFRLTSLLRTEETQNKLSRRNFNATEHSAHLYGTTVDISYKNFFNTQKDTIESSYEAVQTLTNTLIDMRKECKLLVVRERKQSCFHITVVLCKAIPEK